MVSKLSTAVRERPILFSGPMVQAILEGRKTQTRRVVKPQAWDYSNDVLGQQVIYPRQGPSDFGDPSTPIRCPYGAPGGLLWVRETWQEDPAGKWPTCYRATGCVCPFKGHLWRPSIYMPRHLSRLTLRVTSVRVERLQEISEADAQAEGVTIDGLDALGGLIAPNAHRNAFEFGWNFINGKRAPWNSNPWVWVIEFERAEQHTTSLSTA